MSDVGDYSVTVFTIMITSIVCVVADVGICVVVLRLLDKRHMDVLLTEHMS